MNQSAIEVEARDDIVHVTTGAVGAIVRSEVEAQLDAAHKYPRSIKRFLSEAMSLATITQEVAESCIYALERREANGEKKLITGPSVRLAEICASAYGNLHYGGRLIDDDDSFVTAQGGAWDLEKNVRATVEARRRITGRNGRRFSDDMIVVTGNAAVAIALRNAILRVVPRAYIMQVFDKVRAVAVGSAQTLTARRGVVLDRLQKLGVGQDRVLARLEKRGVEDIGLEELEILIGLGASVRNGESTLDEAFPAPSVAPPGATPEAEGKRVRIGAAPEAPPGAPPREPGADG